MFFIFLIRFFTFVVRPNNLFIFLKSATLAVRKIRHLEIPAEPLEHFGKYKLIHFKVLKRFLRLRVNPARLRVELLDNLRQQNLSMIFLL